MRVDGRHYRTIWMEGDRVHLLDQNRLPFELRVVTCPTHAETAEAIREMTVRGAPAIGAAAAFALAQAFGEAAPADPWRAARAARTRIEATRPTARDLFDAVERVWAAAEQAPPGAVAQAAREAAHRYAEESVEHCRRIGEHGSPLVLDGARVLTHCNAGWLATVDYGTALAPVYLSHEQGRRVHVWTCETRPRGQGARLTAWELGSAGIPHAVVADTAAAWLMSRELVDLVIVGADRVAANGDVVNKIGTLERAICAREFGIPFYVAVPRTTFDPGVRTGEEIVIEERPADEVHYQTGLDESGEMRRIRVTAPGALAVNPAFDLTPARYVTGYLTAAGVLTAADLLAGATLGPGPADPTTPAA